MQHCRDIVILLISTIDFDNWKNLLEIALHPSHNYISLLAMFLPSSYFYTIFVQIVVNRLNKLEPPDFAYLLRVLKALPVAKQFAFARFCWRMFCYFNLFTLVFPPTWSTKSVLISRTTTIF